MPTPPDDHPPRGRFLALLGLAFGLFVGYALARPSIESLFLETYGSGKLPYAWGAVALGSAAAALAVGRFVARVEVARLAGLTALAFAGGLAVLLGLREAQVPGAVFLLYVWKDVYVVVLVELFWTYANLVHREASARRSYGFFGISGALGGVVGNLIVGAIAKAIGSARVPWLVVPMLVAFALGAIALGRRAGAHAERRPTADLFDGVRVVAASRVLPLLMALIATVQVAINLVDFEYNKVVEATWPEKDARTGIIGRVYAAIEVLTIGLHALTPLAMRFPGVAGVLLLVPAVLGTLVAAYAISPAFAVMAAAKVASKCFDYSLWRNAKEMLYIPLTFDEKTRGKAVADMFTYRAAKGAASVLLLGLAAAGIASAVPMTLGAIALWGALSVALVRRRATAAPAAEAAPV